MLKFNVGPIHILLDINNHVYVDITGSGAGKTRLYNLLMEYVEASNFDVLGITYDARVDMEQFVLDLLNKKRYTFIFLDRYDLYANERINAKLQELSEYTPILVDIKYTRNLKGLLPYTASTVLGENEVCVYGEDGFRRQRQRSY